MKAQSTSFESDAPDATHALARALAARLAPGDVVLLEGDVGAGKTHFARGAIQSLLLGPEDVPSPTYTLVQTYESTRGEIWHADLYRLANATELEELGLFGAFDDAICFVEWPDRLGDAAPSSALTLTFLQAGAEERRRITANWTDPKWEARLRVLIDV